MITSFAEFEKQYFSPENKTYGYDFVEALSQEDQQALKQEIDNWDDAILKVGNEVLTSYYGMYIPTCLIREFCKDNVKLAFEIYTKGISDTCQRSVLVNTLLHKMGLRSWPTYGEGDEVYNQFLVDLKHRAEQYGIIMLE